MARVIINSQTLKVVVAMMIIVGMFSYGLSLVDQDNGYTGEMVTVDEDVDFNKSDYEGGTNLSFDAGTREMGDEVNVTWVIPEAQFEAWVWDADNFTLRGETWTIWERTVIWNETVDLTFSQPYLTIDGSFGRFDGNVFPDVGGDWDKMMTAMDESPAVIQTILMVFVVALILMIVTSLDVSI